MHASRIVCEVLHAVWHTQEGSLGPPVEGKMHSFYICTVIFISGLPLQVNIASHFIAASKDSKLLNST